MSGLRLFALRIGDRSGEWLCAGIMATWGAAQAIDGGTLCRPVPAALFGFGAAQELWAWMFGGVGLIRLAALYINGRWPRTPMIRMACAGLGFVSWCQLVWLFAQGGTPAQGVPATGAGIYAVLALAELHAIYAAAHDARYDHC